MTDCQVVAALRPCRLALVDLAATSANVSIGDVNGDSHLAAAFVEGRRWPLADLVLLDQGNGMFLPAGEIRSAYHHR